MLRALLARSSDKLTEPRLRLLQLPFHVALFVGIIHFGSLTGLTRHIAPLASSRQDFGPATNWIVTIAGQRPGDEARFRGSTHAGRNPGRRQHAQPCRAV